MRKLLIWSAIHLSLGLVLASSMPHAAMAYSSQPGQCTVAGSMPVHGLAQAGNGGFVITPSSTTYNAGQPMTITLSHPTNEPFKGILLYAFDNAGGPDRLGSFTFTPDYAAVPLGCPGDPNGTLGQTSASLKSTPVDFTWTAPATGGSLTLAAIVLVSTSEYYVLDPVLVDPNTVGVPAPDRRPSVSISLLGNVPNPFGDGTHIRYSLGRPALTSVRIYDLMGRALRDLPILDQDEGEHARRWDGRDASGLALPSGVYFYRVEADGESAVGKLVIQRN